MRLGSIKSVEKGDFVKVCWRGLDEKVALQNIGEFPGHRRTLVKRVSDFFLIAQVIKLGSRVRHEAAIFGPVSVISLEVLFSDYAFVKKGDKIELDILKVNRDIALSPLKKIQLLKNRIPEWRFYYTDVVHLSNEQALIYEL
jgi:hypothetical protein